MDRINAQFNDLLLSLDATITRLSQPEAQGEPDAATEKKYFEAQRRAYTKAQYHHLHGVRAIWTGDAWLVASGTRAGVVHRVARVGLVLSCNCEAGSNERLCWHKLLAEVTELAADRADEYDAAPDAGDFEPPPPPPPAAPALQLVPRDFDDDAGYAAMLAAA
jgi:hypothetical protein